MKFGVVADQLLIHQVVLFIDGQEIFDDAFMAGKGWPAGKFSSVFAVPLAALVLVGLFDSLLDVEELLVLLLVEILLEQETLKLHQH